MGKIGRNEACPCGSGRKFKRCCLGKQQAVSSNLTEVQKAQISLQNAINSIQKAASQGLQKVHELGVFVLFSTTGGDAWLLEITESDALKIASNKEILTVDFEENPETIEISWTHTFEIKDRQFVITAYEDKKVEIIENYPTHPIAAAIKRIMKKYSPELLESVHIDQEQSTGEA
ncbi:MAG: SEC-C domain-containing protein [Deltaproteobacteria bacterium]|nr:MAG: SEC-C domain-containing protein [Deltaproteobacteria bacterium]